MPLCRYVLLCLYCLLCLHMYIHYINHIYTHILFMHYILHPWLRLSHIRCTTVCVLCLHYVYIYVPYGCALHVPTMVVSWYIIYPAWHFSYPDLTQSTHFKSLLFKFKTQMRSFWRPRMMSPPSWSFVLSLWKMHSPTLIHIISHKLPCLNISYPDLTHFYPTFSPFSKQMRSFWSPQTMSQTRSPSLAA